MSYLLLFEFSFKNSDVPPDPNAVAWQKTLDTENDLLWDVGSTVQY